MKLISNLWLYSALSCVSSMTYSGSMGDVSAPSPFNGFYLGGGISAVNMDNHISILETGFPFTDYNSDLVSDTGFNAVGGKINIGYGRLINQGYVGADLAYRYTPTTGGTTQTSNRTFNFPYNFGSAPNDISINLRGGYMFIPGLIAYGIIGANGTQFKASLINSLNYYDKLNKWVPGISPGLGLEFALSSAVTIDARYVYSNYGSSTKLFFDPDGSGAYNHTRFQFQPTIQTMNLSINYHFS